MNIKFNLLQKLIGVVNKAGAKMLALGCVGALVSSVAVAYYVPTKLLGIIVASVGCFLAGLLFAAYEARSMLADRGELDDLRNRNSKLEDNNKELTEANAKLKAKNEVLQSKVNQLAGQRIDVNSIKAVMKLGLAEVDMSIKDFQVCWDGPLEHDFSVFIRAKRWQYVGLLEKDFKAVFGVDMQKLRFRDVGPNICVYGIESENIGMREMHDRWLLRQCQKLILEKQAKDAAKVGGEGFDECNFHYSVDKSEEHELSFDMNRIDQHANQQNADLNQRINNGVGVEFKVLNDYIQNMTVKFLELLLKPTGKKVVSMKGSIPCDNVKSLEEYVDDYNRLAEKSALANAGKVLCE